MPVNQQFDSAELKALNLGYDVISPELSPEVRLVAGQNMQITSFAKLAKRPGTTQLGSFASNVFPGKLDHYILYETLDSPPKIWLVASVQSNATSLYQVWAVRLDGSGTPASVGNLSGTQVSIYPNEMVISRGICYIKSFPGPGVDTFQELGSIAFNGSSNTTTYFGILPPVVPAHVSARGSWANSTFPVTVNFGWYYVYTYITASGQESCRSPLEQNPANASSNTGPFSGTVQCCPQVGIQANADSVNVPLIGIYRSTDNGGSFYRIDTITNTGSGIILYTDRNWPDSLQPPSQPVPDTGLDTSKIAPSLTQNSPPPAVAFSITPFTTLNGAITNVATSVTFNTSFNGATLATTAPTLPFTAQIDNEYVTVSALNTGSGAATIQRGVNGSQKLLHASSATVSITPVVGLDFPARSTPMATYAGRIWYGIGNVLFFSGQEEIGQGVPEECWPSGLYGNFYRFSYPIVNVYSTSEALYVLCTEEIYWLRGNTKDTFQLIKLFGDLGAKRGHPRAVCCADKSLVWLTQDLRLAMARGYKREFLSDKIATDIRTAVAAGSSIHLLRHAELEKDWLIMLAVNSTLATCKQWIFDFNAGQEGLWSVPWTQPVTAAASGQPFDTSDLTRHLTWASSGGVTTNQYTTTDITGVTVTDFVPGTGASNYAADFTVSLIRNPTGNHVNQLREPGMVSILHAIKLDRTKFTSDTDPTLAFSLDDLTYSAGSGGSQGGTNSTPEIPPRREQSTGYTTLWYMVDQKCERVAAKFSKAASSQRFEVQAIAYIFNPDTGA